MVIITGLFVAVFALQYVALRNMTKERDFYRGKLTQFYVRTKGSRGLAELQKEVSKAL